TVCLGATFADLDQDGDLDLLVAQFADTPQAALKALRSGNSESGPGLAVFINVGHSPARSPSEDPPPLKPKFERLNSPPSLSASRVSAVSTVISDFDGDLDLDVLLLADHAPVRMIVNDRLLRFHQVTLPASLIPAGQWNGGLVLDARHQGRSDLFLIGPAQAPLLLVNNADRGKRDPTSFFEVAKVNCPPLLQAQGIDIDLDGRTDVVGLSTKGLPVLVHNTGTGLAQA